MCTKADWARGIDLSNLSKVNKQEDTEKPCFSTVNYSKDMGAYVAEQQSENVLNWLGNANINILNAESVNL